MQLKDVIHFYLGAKAKRFPEGAIVDITLWQLEQFIIGHCGLIPILRRLESMTEEDKKDMLNRFSRFDLSRCTYEYSDFPDIWINAIENGRVIESLSVDLSNHVVSIMNDASDMRPYRSQSDTFHYLISKRFDLFDLIDSGDAIDEETLKQ